ncbi:LexA/Signal peptidase [Nadsonia fulvescens var. elongata DSM 6958]|uniref:Mitochondrial inner membrane protease subunit 2 n=1 Tax=Nadsonia fulvescens var. elongata DSM 6958 TaxID=857566 RepID=A0A1E3PES0_9ASCO|nr:LexA/Signal peptidase [Nadsonia fulvescens var. elongata DSM 6958]
MSIGTYIKTGIITLTWIPVLATVCDHVAFFGHIEGSSMKPALNPDASLGWTDTVWLKKWGIHKPGSIQVGDVVLLRSPDDPEKILAKRVLAVGGDEVVTRKTYPRPVCRIPPNHIWAEGDNIHSIDSNNFGPVSTGLIIGKASNIVFPFNRFGPVPNGGREARLSHLNRYHNSLKAKELEDETDK